jgi:hypothetical protein
VAIRAAQQATKTIPILAFTDDLIGSGLVDSMARPSGNTTGISLLANELDGKRQELLIEIVPVLRRIAALADSNTTSDAKLRVLEESARSRDIELSIYRVAKGEEIAAAIDAAKVLGATALNVLASPLLWANRQLITDRVAVQHLPAMYFSPELAEEGGFAAYGPRAAQLYRDVLARQLVEILRGTKVPDIPVEQPTTCPPISWAISEDRPETPQLPPRPGKPAGVLSGLAPRAGIAPAASGRRRKSSHSITSSAVASSVGGTVRPSALAVLRLMTIKYFVGNWTGSRPASSHEESDQHSGRLDEIYPGSPPRKKGDRRL